MARSKKSQPTKAPSKGSKFAKGAFKLKLHSPGKDARNVMFMQGVQNGVVVVWFEKPKGGEAAFMVPDFAMLDANDELMESLGINAIVPRRGDDGSTAMTQSKQSKYPWIDLRKSRTC